MNHLVNHSLHIQPFSKSYDGVTVLDFPGIALQTNKIYAVIGSNGCGKSTFAKILAGVLQSDQKRSCLNGVSIGYMPQKNYAFRMTTRANIMLNGNDRERADRLMDALQIRHLEQKRADRLSGGETARMTLARLMMKRYDVIILDEPTASMDMETTSLSEELIAQYVSETGCALILVTHSLQQARRIADEVLFFHKGQLLEASAKEIVLYHPEHLETQKFLNFYGI